MRDAEEVLQYSFLGTSTNNIEIQIQSMKAYAGFVACD